MKSIIQKYPTISYFVLAYLFAWVFIPLLSISLAFGFLALFGPALSAILVTYITEGSPGTKALYARALLWKVKPVWYAFAILFPPFLILIEMGIAYLFKTSVSFFTNGIVGLVTAVLYVGEELGWRGYALPKLLQQRTPFAASLILGVLWAMWHLPNFVFPLEGVPPLGPFPVVALWVVSQTFLFTWLYMNSNGSVLITTLFHASINAFTFNGMDITVKWILQAVFWLIAAIIVVLTSRKQWVQQLQ